jgi:hypothetical protein
MKKKINDFSKIKFERSPAEFKDGRKMVTAHLKGNFTRGRVLVEMQSFADAFNAKGRNYYMGMSAHYEYPNDWTPALYRHVGSKQVLYNPTDSPTTEGYKDIDGLYLYIIEMPADKPLHQKMHKKKSEKSMFAKYKK